MGYTSQQYLAWLHQENYSDQAVADEMKYSRETITRIRLGTPGYTGTRINRKLEKLVRQLQQEQAQEPQEPQAEQPHPPAQVVTPVASPPSAQVQQTSVQGKQCPNCLKPYSGKLYLLWGSHYGCNVCAAKPA